VQLCGLGDDLITLLRFPVEYQEIRAGGLDEFCQGLRLIGRWHHVVGSRDRDELGWPFGEPLGVPR